MSSLPPSNQGTRLIEPSRRKSPSLVKLWSSPASLSSSGLSAAQEREKRDLPELLELVRARVAQIHQSLESFACHAATLKAQGDGARLDELETWQTSTLFTDAQRAALALCERITLDPADPFPDSLPQDMHRHFTNDGIISVTVAIVAAVDWNFPRALQLEPTRLEI
jgi:alkylhydroperoxidase family enzyme